MKIVLLVLLFCLCGLTLSAQAEPVSETAADQLAVQPDNTPDSQQMSRDLQSLPWKPFKAIIEAIPKLAADVDAYGPLGWQFVRENYATYNWRKKIDKLDAMQKRQLADLISKARSSP